MRVITYHEAASVGQFESKDRFTEMDGLIQEGCQDLVDQGLIIGAFPFGSSQFNDANSLSDYDIAMAIGATNVDEETQSLNAIHRLAKSAYARTGIPLEVSCYTLDQLTEGLHHLPDTMLEWLKDQARSQDTKVIGYNFIPHIRQIRQRQSAPTLAHIDTFVDSSRSLMRKTWLQGAYFRPHDLLSVTLNTPHIIGRKVIDTLQHSGAIPDDTLKDLTKKSIGESVFEVFGSETEIGTLYRAISDDRRRYTEELIPQVGQLNPEEYDQIIESVLEDNLPKAIELLRRIQEACRELYNQSSASGYANTQPYVESGSNLTAQDHHDRRVAELRVQQLNSS